MAARVLGDAELVLAALADLDVVEDLDLAATLEALGRIRAPFGRDAHSVASALVLLSSCMSTMSLPDADVTLLLSIWTFRCVVGSIEQCQRPLGAPVELLDDVGVDLAGDAVGRAELVVADDGAVGDLLGVVIELRAEVDRRLLDGVAADLHAELLAGREGQDPGGDGVAGRVGLDAAELQILDEVDVALLQVALREVVEAVDLAVGVLYAAQVHDEAELHADVGQHVVVDAPGEGRHVLLRDDGHGRVALRGRRGRAVGGARVLDVLAQLHVELARELELLDVEARVLEAAFAELAGAVGELRS